MPGVKRVLMVGVKRVSIYPRGGGIMRVAILTPLLRYYPLYYDVTTPLYYDVTTPSTMTSLPPQL